MGKPGNSQLKKTLVAAGALILLTLIVYLPAIHCGYVWDDDAYVTANPLLTDANGLKRIWFSFDSPSQYFPLVYTAFRMEHALWGFDPLGYHLVNVLIHIINALLVWLVLSKLGIRGAWLAGAIFALHPVNVESVAWITERKNTLSTLFYLLTVLAWLRFASKDAGQWWRYYGLALILYALALFAKTTACTLPATLLIVLWVKGERVDWKRVGQTIPFLAMGVAMGLLSVWWEQNVHGIKGLQFAELGQRPLIAGHAVWFYLMKLVLPIKLTFSYPKWFPDTGNPLEYLWPGTLILLAAALWFSRKRLGSAAILSLAFFVANLAPVLGFIDLYTFRYSFVADHYQYVASVGPIVLFAVGISRKWCIRGREFSVPTAIPLIILIILGLLTWSQTHAYHDVETLWRDTLAKNPAAWMAYINLAGSEYHEGRYDEAIAQYQECLKAVPDCAEAYVGMSAVYARTGHVERAIECLKQALKISPMSSEANYNYAEILAARGQYDEAIARYKIAIKSTPDRVRTHTHLGIALLRRGKASDAADHFMAALRINPTWEEAYRNLQLARRREPLRPGAMDHCIQGIQFELKGDAYRAIEEYQKAVEADPSFAEAYMCLGVAYRKLGEIDQAIEEYQAAIQIKPKLVDAHSNLAFAYYTQGDAARAWEEIKLVRKYGGRPNRRFLEILSKLMPEPK